MTSRKTSSVGSGITKFDVEHTSISPTDSSGIAELLSRSASFGRNSFERRFSQDVEAVRERLAALRASVGPTYDFEEYADEGWFCERVDVLFRRAKRAAKEGRISQALDNAARMGMLLGEMQLKFTWESLALKGQREGRLQQQGAENRRLASDNQRYAIVESIEAERRQGFRDAFRKAAERHGDLGTFHAFKSSFYKIKSSKPSD